MKLSGAIKANDPEAVAKSLKRVKNINRPMRDTDYTPLLLAARQNADRVIPLLMDAGAKLELKRTLHPLYHAATKGGTAALLVLLDMRTWEPDLVLDAFRAAATAGETEALRLLMDKAGAVPTIGHLRSVARSGRLEAFTLLLEHGCDPQELRDGTSALHEASLSGFPKIIGAILERGADVNLRDAKGRTPLMRAMAGHTGQRLERAKYRRRMRVMADPESTTEFSGYPVEPAHARRTIEVLLEAGADPTLTDNDGRTGMDILVQDDHRVDKWLEKRLKTAGAPPVDYWPIDLVDAISAGNTERLRDLLSGGRDVNFANSRSRDSSMLCLACRIGNETNVRLLLDAGADPNRPDDTDIPLTAAVFRERMEVVRVLLDAGADPNLTNPGEYRYTPLEHAKSMGYLDIAEILSQRGAKLPKPKHERVEPGVHWWDDWEFVVVKADVKTIVEAIDPTGKSIDPAPLGKTFTSRGRGTYVVVQPKGLAWSNVLRTSPVWRNMEDDFKQVAQQLAEACKTKAIHAAYSDCAGAAAFVCYEADGSTGIDDGGADLESAEMVVSYAEDQGNEPPAWAVEMIEKAEQTGEDPPDSSKRLQALANSERFALGWAYFGVRPGEEFEIEFLDYPPEAFEAVAFVDTPS